MIHGGTGESEEVESSEGNSSYGNDNSFSMLLLTGPNYSGKSVYLKQVWVWASNQGEPFTDVYQIAMIVYMAHIGRYMRVIMHDRFLGADVQ